MAIHTAVRPLLSPRAVGLGLLAAALMAVMVVLGLWQLDVYHANQRSAALEALSRKPVPLASVLGPDDPFPSDGASRPVTVSGHYVTGEQFWVHQLPGAKGRYAVVTPLVTQSGSAILVVRGAAETKYAAAPSGTVTITGVLEPSQAQGGPPGPDGVTNGIRISSLVNAVGTDLYSGYVIRQPGDAAHAAAGSAELSAVTPPLPDPSRWAGIRNFVYAVQWWVFAAFVAFMWWKIVHDLDRDHQRRGSSEDRGEHRVSTGGEHG